jgi:hypothetical protein
MPYAADIVVMKTSPALHQFAWLFTRDQESVRMQILEHRDAYRLVLNGPGSTNASHDFDTLSSLMIFVTNYQEQLRSNNFKLQASAERRGTGGGGGERRVSGFERRRA